MGSVKPLLIIASLMFLCAMVAYGCSAGTAKSSDWVPLSYQCPACNGQQVVDSDIVLWQCKWCKARHWQGVGNLDPNRPAGK